MTHCKNYDKIISDNVFQKVSSFALVKHFYKCSAEQSARIGGFFKRVGTAAHFNEQIVVRQIHIVFTLAEVNGSHKPRVHFLADALQIECKSEVLLPVGE